MNMYLYYVYAYISSFSKHTICIHVQIRTSLYVQTPEKSTPTADQLSAANTPSKVETDLESVQKAIDFVNEKEYKVSSFCAFGHPLLDEQTCIYLT